MSAKSCKPGYYWCYTDKKCKKIPLGWHVGRGGYLSKDEDEDSKSDKNGGNGNVSNGNGNGNGSNGSGSGNSGSNGNGGGGVSEGTLRKWFKGSKSKDGKGGWVNVVTGGTCASDEPGEGTPKCVSSAKRASMSKKERLSAARRKKKADPGQQQKSGAAKPTYVATDKKKVKEDIELTDAYGNTFATIHDVIEKEPMKSDAPPIESYETYDIEAMVEEKDKKGKGSGTKDACYHKVKSRYSVWPSAYASGALVKCRKVGAANWGNSTKKEEYSDWKSELFDEGAMPAAIDPKAHRNQQRAAKVRNLASKGSTEGERSAAKGKTKGPDLFGEDCWDGYEKKGMKTMFGKRYPNCVKKKKTRKEETECSHTKKGEECPVHGMESCPSEVSEAVRVPAKTGNIISVMITWRGKGYSLKMFFPQAKRPTRQEVELEVQKVYPDGRVRYMEISDIKPGEQFLQVSEGAAWTKKSGKNKEGGLNEKGRKSYERENPGSDLKAPSKKVGNPRRASFCARMKGMKKKLTSSKTANDPDSRINKSLRAWNC
jgi:hypothetical protein